MLAPLLLLAALSTEELKVDREPHKDCFLAESFKRDLIDAGFSVVTTDRATAARYISTLVTLGVEKPPIDLSKLEGLVIVTTPEVADAALVGLVTNDGQICAAINIPRNVHDAILRGA